MNFLAQRLFDYAAKRLQEPSTIAGIVLAATGLAHYNAPPEVQAFLTQIGLSLVGLILFFVREGRNKPDNPTLSTTVKGALPVDPPRAIVPPPATDSMQPVKPSDKLAVDSTGVVHDSPVPSNARSVDPTLAHRPGFHRDDP